MKEKLKQLPFYTKSVFKCNNCPQEHLLSFLVTVVFFFLNSVSFHRCQFCDHCQYLYKWRNSITLVYTMLKMINFKERKIIDMNVSVELNRFQRMFLMKGTSIVFHDRKLHVFFCFCNILCCIGITCFHFLQTLVRNIAVIGVLVTDVVLLMH